MRIIGVMLASLALVSMGGRSGKVESTVDTRADFRALHTYSWTAGAAAFDASEDSMIVEAFDAEMTRLGFTRAPTGADVALAYYTVAITYLDSKTLRRLDRGDRRAAPALTRMTLVAVMRKGTSSRQLWTASTREILNPDRSTLGDTIRRVAARLFETYPRGRHAG